jgi:hypothetical protein
MPVSQLQQLPLEGFHVRISVFFASVDDFGPDSLHPCFRRFITSGIIVFSASGECACPGYSSLLLPEL